MHSSGTPARLQSGASRHLPTPAAACLLTCKPPGSISEQHTSHQGPSRAGTLPPAAWGLCHILSRALHPLARPCRLQNALQLQHGCHQVESDSQHQGTKGQHAGCTQPGNEAEIGREMCVTASLPPLAGGAGWSRPPGRLLCLASHLEPNCVVTVTGEMLTFCVDAWNTRSRGLGRIEL